MLKLEKGRLALLSNAFNKLKEGLKHKFKVEGNKDSNNK